MKSWVYLLVFASVSFHVFGSIANAGCVVKTLKMLATQVEKPMLDDIDIQEISHLFQCPQLNSHAARIAFDKYMASRLDLLPMDIQKSMNNILMNHNEFLVKARINGSYSSGYRTIKRILPKQLEHSALDYLISTHEAEHAIQFATLNQDWLMPAGKLKLSYVTEKYLLEKGAMTAEWNYIRSIPASERTKIIDEVNQISSLSNKDKKMVSRVLSNAELSLDEYLAAEWSAGRYSQSAIRKKAYVVRSFVYGIPLGATGYVLWLKCRVASQPNSKMQIPQYCHHFFKVPSGTNAAF